MTMHCTVVDYGRGNLYSVGRAVEQCGAEASFAATPEEVRAADRLILPGVGAFGAASTDLARLGLDDALRGYAATGRPLLGICLGMQLLFDWSDEFGRHAGLGLIPGGVEAIPATAADGRPHKVPHIGWNALQRPESRAVWRETILSDVTLGESVYFVHSFFAQPREETHRLADCTYNGRRIAAAVQLGAIWGCQFHPEKSGPTGLRIMANFLRQ